MAVRRAQCSCGQLRALCEGDPTKVSVCHCGACQRRTASAFGVAAFFERPKVSIEGESTVFRRIADSGKAITFHFCPACGSTVYWEPERMPDLIAVGTGAFADPSFPAPVQSIFDDMRQGWITLSDTLTKRASQ